MIFKVKTIKSFERQAKRLIKKYPSLFYEINAIIDSLELNPVQGTSISNEIYKIRISIKSKGKGKSGGGRIITTLKITDKEVFLLSIYDKSEQENVTEKELQELLKEIPNVT